MSVGESGQDLNVSTGLTAAHLTSALVWEKTWKRVEKKRPRHQEKKSDGDQ